MALWDDLVAYYKCGDGSDSWGKYSVSLDKVEIADGIGPTFSSWDFATSGSSGKAEVVQDVKIPADTGIATVSMWFKGLQSGNGSAFVATNNNTLIRIASSKLGIRVGGVTSSGYNISHLRGLSTWTHIAVSADGAGNYEFYINGSNVGSIVGGAVWDDDIKRIGNLTGSDDEFADYLTDIAFWSRVLTSDEVELIYSNGAGGTRDLTRLIPYTRKQLPDDQSDGWFNMSGNVLLWHLDDAGGGSEVDGSGNGHTGTPASVSNTTGIYMHSASYLTSSTGNAFGTAASFNGSNSDVDAASATATALGINSSGAPRTTLCWASHSSWTSNDNIFAMGNNATRQDWSLLTRDDGFKLNTWSDDLTWDGMTGAEKEGWFHVAAVYDGTTMRLYLNGTERATRTPSALNTADNYPLRVGNDHGYNGNPWDGKIQEFAMFDEALGAADILTIYNQQKGWVSGSYSVTSGSASVAAVFATVVHEGGSAVALDNVFATVVHEGGSAVALDNVFATVVHEGGSAVALDNVFATVVHTTSSYLTLPNITGTVAETASFSAVGSYGVDDYRWSWNFVPGTGSGVVSGSFAFPDGGVNTWQGNMTDNTALYHCNGALTASAGSDSSGQGNTVSFSGITFNSDPYIGSGSWGFDGATSYVACSGGILDCSGDWTVSLWLYNLDTSGIRVGLVGNPVSVMPITVWTSGELGYCKPPFVGSGAELTASDGWHNLVVVANESKDKVDYWIDGVKEGTVYEYHDAGNISSIGNRVGTSYKFADRIDEFAFWTRSLSDEEIERIYFLQNSASTAASGNFGPTLSFVPQLTGNYGINLEVYPGVTGSATASILTNDCNGDPGGTAYINTCGWCVEGTTGRESTYGQEICWDGSTVCSASSGSVPSASCVDCNEVSGGTAYINDCGFCVSGTTGKPTDYGKFTCWDGSIICSASESPITTGSCPDCYGVPGGSAYTNSCGTCVGGTTGRGEFWGMVTCWDGSLVCRAGDCPIISGSATDYMIGSAYEIQNTRNATRQRSRRNFQVPYLLSNNTALTMRKGPDTNFSGSY